MILPTGWRPFGHDAFAFGLLGLPGLIFVHKSVDLDTPAGQALVAHEIQHWWQWIYAMTVLLGLWAIAGLLGVPWVSPWYLTALWAPQALYLAVPLVRRWAEEDADQVQLETLDRLRERD